MEPACLPQNLRLSKLQVCVLWEVVPPTCMDALLKARKVIRFVGGGWCLWVGESCNEIPGLWILFVLVTCMLHCCIVPAGELLVHCRTPYHCDLIQLRCNCNCNTVSFSWSCFVQDVT